MKPTALIIRAAGTNCDLELAHAFELAGAVARTCHLNQLAENPQWIGEVGLIGFPGGFSYGDDIAAGRIFAQRLRHELAEPLRQAVARRVPMIGICNGFQVMASLGLLPDPLADGPLRQSVTLAENSGGRFIDRWVPLRVPDQTVCIWTRGLDGLQLPIAHGEGRFVPADDQVLSRLRDSGQIALRYTAADDPAANPNGSVDDIAGICDPSGVVLGLMPHPERYTTATQHPQWTRLPREALTETPVGLRLFKNAVEFVQAGAPAASALS